MIQDTLYTCLVTLQVKKSRRLSFQFHQQHLCLEQTIFVPSTALYGEYREAYAKPDVPFSTVFYFFSRAWVWFVMYQIEHLLLPFELFQLVFLDVRMQLLNIFLFHKSEEN